MENWKTRITTCIYALLLFTLPFTECQECGDNPMKQVLMVAKRTGEHYFVSCTLACLSYYPSYSLPIKQTGKLIFIGLYNFCPNKDDW